VLEYCVPADLDLFGVPTTDPAVVALRDVLDMFDVATATESPTASITNPQV
jgi:hypothetical protein